MDSALSPREIQSCIRAGLSLEEVAQAAGVPVEQVEPYAAPVLAEREHVTSSALTSPVRRRGESSSNRSMRTVVAERLKGRDIDPETVEWDSWRDEDRHWSIKASYHSGSSSREALFRYEPKSRYSSAVNDEARWLIGEHSPTSHGPQPGHRRRPDQDNEPTLDLNDELALVRAIQDGDSESPEAAAEAEEAGEPDAAAEQGDTRGQHGGPNDYSEAELEQVDGVYDIVPPRQSNMDVLYDLLSSFDEDSVNIYAGLNEPVVEALPEVHPVPTTQVEAPQASTEQDEVVAEESIEVEVSELEHEEPVAEASPAGVEPGPLLDSAAPAAKPKARKKRASVPSWDEIMFGGPQPGQTD